MSMMTLGEYQFSVGTAAFQSLSRTTAYRWNNQERLGRAPAVQFTGPGEETLSIEGVIYPHYQGGLGQVAAMRGEAAQGRTLLLMNEGEKFGYWVIESVTENQSVFCRNGLPQRIEFSLSLRKAGEIPKGNKGKPGAKEKSLPPTQMRQTFPYAQAGKEWA